MSEAAAMLALGVVVYFCAGAVKGLLGIGLPTLAVGLMAQFVDAREAVATVIVPMLVANAWQVARSGAPLAVTRRVWTAYRPLVLTMLGVLGTVALLAPRVSATAVTAALGLVVTLFAATSLWREPPPLPDRLDRPAQLIAGAGAGVIGGLSGIWAPPIILYLGARRLEREDFVETIGVLLLAGTVVLCAGYAASGLLAADVAARSLLLVPPALVGFALGERGRRTLSGSRFRTLVLGFFLVMGLNLLRRALTGAA